MSLVLYLYGAPLSQRIIGWNPYQSCHEERRSDASFSDPPTKVRNVAPWQELAEKVKQ